jgi:hypothetical protein
MKAVHSLTETKNVKLAIAAFNRGDINKAIQSFTNDVEIVIPIYRVSETAGDMKMTGTTQLRRLLEQRLATGIPINLLSYARTDNGALVTLNSSVEGEVAVAVRFNDEGLVSHLSIFKT